MKKLVVAAFIAIAGAAFADSTPVMGSLITPVQLPSSDYDVTGLRLSLIYGQCNSFTGLDLGIANRSTGDFLGIGLGGANIVEKRVVGGHLGLVNWNGSSVSEWTSVSKGAQIGIVNYAGAFCGLQDGFLNISDNVFTGLEVGLLNFANDINGVQCGGYLIFGANFASGTLSGLQIGLVNYAAKMDGGLQIGIVNIISEGGWMPVFPILNGDF